MIKYEPVVGAYSARKKTFCVSVMANQETLREVCKYLQSAQRQLMDVSKKVNENLVKGFVYSGFAFSNSDCYKVTTKH